MHLGGEMRKLFSTLTKVWVGKEEMDFETLQCTPVNSFFVLGLCINFIHLNYLKTFSEQELHVFGHILYKDQKATQMQYKEKRKKSQSFHFHDVVFESAINTFYFSE